MLKTKQSYQTDFEKFGKRWEKSIFVPSSSPEGPMGPNRKNKTFLVYTHGTIPASLREIRLWDQWDPNRKNKPFLVFTHTTIPASLKEIRPAVSEMQLLTNGPTQSDDYRPSGLPASGLNPFATWGSAALP